MPLQTSGAISLNQIHVEAGGTSGTQASINDADIRGLISKASGAQMSFSEWYGASAFSWTSPTGGFSYSPSQSFSVEAEDREGNTASARTTINITWNSNGTHNTSYTDSGVAPAASSIPGAGTNTGGNIVSSTNSVSILEARWVFVDADIDFGSGADSNEYVFANYTPGGSIAATTATVRTHTQGDVNDLDYSDSWRTITPAVMGGSGSNSQSFNIGVTAQSFSSSTSDFVRLLTSATSDYIGLQIRANSDDSTILTLRSSLTNTVSIEATSFEIPEFTCIMPDMIVKEETKGYIRIGDVVVGDRILAKGDLNDSTVESIYAEVTEARTHTRSGYWNVDGLHITNDHPVWLEHEGSGNWVKVEDMWDGITRNYVAGTVDPVYLGTTPGHYYVYTDNYKFTVSGDYAPTTE